MDGVKSPNERFTVAQKGHCSAIYSLKGSSSPPEATLWGDIFEIDFNYDLIGYMPVAHRQRIVH
ncbi:hypothetical protein [Rhizobium sp. H4]|uniref:hypothetical protein n=1 Tax=Rhizobium sp. H4 TaxID=2035449 RepID=UPI00131DE7DD|nr:hypothetical protein [Rhizobium sp. H4]